MEVIKFNNPGVLIDTLPQELFSKLKNFLLHNRSIQQQNNNSQIKRGLKLLSIKEVYDVPYFKELDDYLQEIYIKWCESFDVNPVKVRVNSVWVNYMKKTEYSPLHAHVSHLSFVIWVKIPYNLQQEISYHNKFNENCHIPDDGSVNGKFVLLYHTFTGPSSFHFIELSKDYEGKIIMFPSQMLHAAYPFFSSDEERISIAGDIGRIEN